MAAPTATVFDKAYYDRYYRNRRTRVSSSSEVERLGRFICSYLAYVQLPVQRVLDAGCGLGRFRSVIAAQHPKARYVGIEVSEYLCAKYGWENVSIASYRPRGRFDLIICQGVLQYLDDAEAALALENLGRMCRGALFLEALTREDWQEHCDKRRTDGAVHLRSANWYRRRLAKHFRPLGGGLFLHRDAEPVFFALENVAFEAS